MWLLLLSAGKLPLLNLTSPRDPPKNLCQDEVGQKVGTLKASRCTKISGMIFMKFLCVSFQFFESSLWQWNNNTLWNPPEQPDVGLLLAK